MKVRRGGRIVSVAVIIAVGVNADGRREVLGMEIGTSEAEPIWTEFLRKLTRRGLRGVKLVVSDAHEGLKAAVTKVLCATWQRCRVHFMRNVLAHAGKSGRRVVSAFIATAFAQETPEAASVQWRAVADQIRPKVPKLATIMDDAEPDVLAYMTFPKEHRAKLHSTNPIERLNGEIKRRTELVGISGRNDCQPEALRELYLTFGCCSCAIAKSANERSRSVFNSRAVLLMEQSDSARVECDDEQRLRNKIVRLYRNGSVAPIMSGGRASAHAPFPGGTRLGTE
ncbi:transposase [Mesorhizobium sp. LSHC426A00]|nr:transposase [Mesorhizobium sp. LSHC426A00]